MTIEFKLPDIGEGIAEGEIVKWLVSKGDSVEEHQPVVEVMTDKATVELPAPAAGRVTEFLAEEGDVVPVGQVIFRIETDGADQGEQPQAPEERSGEGADGSGKKPDDERSRESKPIEHGASQQGEGAPKSKAKPEAKAGPKREPKSRPQARPKAGSPGGRTIEFKLPDIGEGIAEGEIVKWLVGEGDSLEEHQPVVEVMTDKATVELPAPAAGTLAKILAAEGEVVPVGQVLFELQTGAGDAPPADEEEQEDDSAEEPDTEGDDARREPAQAEGGRKASAAGAGGKVLAVPSARRVARELGIDLAEVPGSGRNGVVRRKDVEAFAKSGATPAREAAAPTQKATPAAAPAEPARAAPTYQVPAAGRSEERIPFRGVRRKIAEAMTRSMYTAPHFTVVEEVDVTELVALRAKAKALGEEIGVKVTYMPFIMKATALALVKFPMLNGRLDEDKNELVRPSYADLGIATDTPNGLVVPVVRDVQAKGILQLAAETAELAERTRSGRVKPEELRGSTFSITNAGNIGGTLATPIINFPDIAILGVHRIRKAPGVVETPEGDRIEVRQYMNLSLSVDHRLADGADGARMLVYMKQLLESPGLLAL